MIQRYGFYNSEPSDIGPYYDPCDDGDWVKHSDHENHIVDLRKKVEIYEDLLSDIHDFLSSLKEAREVYSSGQQPFYIYTGLINRIDKIIKKCEG